MRASLASTMARLGLVLSIVLATAALTVTAGRAYNNDGPVPCPWAYGGGSSLLYLDWYNDSTFPPVGDYATAYSYARADWNDMATPTWFTPGYLVKLQVQYKNNPYFGATSVSCFGGLRITTTIYLNEHNLDA